MFLAQVINSNSSCQKAVTDTVMKRLISGLGNCSQPTGGDRKARQRIPLKLVKTLAQQSAKIIEEQAPSAWKFKAQNVKLIDGTTVRIIVQHRSGIPNYSDHKGYWENPPQSRKETLKLALDLHANFELNGNHGYSNTNYLLIGELIDKVVRYNRQKYI